MDLRCIGKQLFSHKSPSLHNKKRLGIELAVRRCLTWRIILLTLAPLPLLLLLIHFLYCLIQLNRGSIDTLWEQNQKLSEKLHVIEGRILEYGAKTNRHGALCN